MKSFKIVFTFALLIAAFSSCQEKETLAVDNNVDDVPTPLYIDGDGKKYVEYACITPMNEAGILCGSGVNGSCKKESSCTAVSSSVINGSQYFTQWELDNWEQIDFHDNEPFMDHMVQIGWFYAE